ncbi:MAG TPA: hypothetical protein VGD74_11475 [Vulgatibacter sp.]
MRITEPPVMRPARAEMRDLKCAGAWGKTPCGRTVALACPRCGCHRCARCTAKEERCPMCVLTDMYWPELWMSKPKPRGFLSRLFARFTTREAPK